jgi:hypothetical protein
MILIPVLCPRCHPDQVMKGAKTKAHLSHQAKVLEVSEVAEFTGPGVLMGVFSSWTRASQRARRPWGA